MASRLGSVSRMLRAFGLLALLVGPAAAQQAPVASANERAVIGHLRAVLAAQKAYAAVNGGYYDTLECLAAPSACLPVSPAPGPFLSPELFVAKEEGPFKAYPPIHGYKRFFIAGARAEPAPGARISSSSITGFGYAAIPEAPGETGIHGFLADDLGRICFHSSGAVPPIFGAGRCAFADSVVGLNDELVVTGPGFPMVATAAEPPKPRCPQGPFRVAVNSVTNKIYVVNGAGAILSGARVSTKAHPPSLVAVNATTNKICVLKRADSVVVVIDGATNDRRTVSVGSSPGAIEVDPGTNRIYVANSLEHNVTVIDGATDATTFVAPVFLPWSLAVNPVSQKTYVASVASDSVTVIDGATNATTTVSGGSFLESIAVNPVTNKIYVASLANGDVTVIDGATNATTTVAGWSAPESSALDRAGDTVCPCAVTIIDGATNVTSAVLAGSGPEAVAVNPVTNKIYVANGDSGTVTVIDGATNATTTVGAGSGPTALAVNPVTNKIYVANRGSNNVTVIDGATNGTTTVSAGSAPASVAVNPKTNKIYVVNSESDDVTAIDGRTNATTTLPVVFTRRPGDHP